MIWQGLKAELAGDSHTAAYLAGLDGAPDRIYPLVIPQKVPRGVQTVPCVVYQETAVERQLTYCGTSGLVRSRMALDIYATSYDQCKLLAAAVRNALQDFNGLLGGIVDVRNAILETELELQDIEPGLYRVTQSWAFWHVET